MKVFDVRRQTELMKIGAIANASFGGEDGAKGFNDLYKEIRGNLFYEEKLDRGRWLKKMKGFFSKIKNVVLKAKVI